MQQLATVVTPLHRVAFFDYFFCSVLVALRHSLLSHFSLMFGLFTISSYVLISSFGTYIIYLVYIYLVCNFGFFFVPDLMVVRWLTASLDSLAMISVFSTSRSVTTGFTYDISITEGHT